MINKLPERLKNEILEYCKLNSIDNIESFIIKLITQSFTIEKFGENPLFVNKKERVFEPEVIVKEVIVEKIVEVPVEKVVEKIVEIEKPMVVVEETKPSKNEYVIELEPKKDNPTPKPNIDTIPKPNLNDDIYGEGKGGWLGGSNLYELLKGKK
jgi:hypothetical protein